MKNFANTSSFKYFDWSNKLARKMEKKNWHILWLATTDAKGMHEAKITHVSKKSIYHKTRYLFVTFTKTIYKFIS